MCATASPFLQRFVHEVPPPAGRRRRRRFRRAPRPRTMLDVLRLLGNRTLGFVGDSVSSQIAHGTTAHWHTAPGATRCHSSQFTQLYMMFVVVYVAVCCSDAVCCRARHVTKVTIGDSAQPL